MADVKAGPMNFTLSKRAPAVRFFFACLFAFLILYNITFHANEIVTTGRISVAILLIWYILAVGKFPLRFGLEIYAIFIPLPYVIVQLFFVGDWGQFSRFVNLAIYSYLGAMLISRFIGSLEALLWVFLICIAFQALILMFSFGNISFRSWIDSVIIIGANFDAFNLYRAIGLTSSAGSSLSVIQSLGVLCGGWLLLIRTKKVDLWSINLIITLMLLCLLSCAIVGRTGLYLSFLFLFLSAYFSNTLRFLIYWIPVFGVLALFLDQSLILKLIPSEISVDWLLNWMLGIFSPDDETISTLYAMPLPQLDSIDSWVGYGRISLVDGVNPSGHDSGIVQALYSMGIIFGAIFYFAYFFVLKHLLSWLPVAFKFFVVALLLLIEIKEPFVFKYAILFVLVAANALARCDGRVRELVHRRL